jgi:hypothetical protein
MTDGTPAPLTPPKTERRTYRLPAAVADEVSTWADVRGISDNAAYCLLIRTGLANAIANPSWLPPRLQLRGADASPAQRTIVLPAHLYEILVSWADMQPHMPGRDVATAVLCMAAITHSIRTEVPLPYCWPPRAASTNASPDPTEED